MQRCNSGWAQPPPAAERPATRGARAKLALLPALRVLAAGGVVAYPTEGVFGIGCDPWRLEALERIRLIKGRRRGKGFILIGSRLRHLAPFVAALADYADRIAVPAERPTTWLVPASPAVPAALLGGRRTVAVRLVGHPIAAALCDGFGGAIVSTSANRSGATPARTTLGARCRLGRDVDLVLPGACGPEGRASRIVELATGAVVRP
jgi:L-threonylcarbamoyladenylate synthase